MSEKQPKQVRYYDPEGEEQTGWYQDGHVYQDEALTTPISVGSTFRNSKGKYYRMTPYGGVLWSNPKQENKGSWIPQGNHWYRTAADLVQRLDNREAFRYDPEQDPLYLGARNQYVRQGQRAMTDTLGKASALTGGYASSFAQQVGQQAYSGELTKLSQLLPEFYDTARKSYDAETKTLLDQISSALGLYDQDYQTYLDRVKRDQWEKEFALGQDKYQDSLDHWAAEYQLDQQKQTDARDKWEQENALNRDKFNASLDQWTQEFGLNRDKFNASLDQWTQEFGLDREKFAASLAQWAEKYGLDREKFEASLDQWAAEFAQEEQQWEDRRADEAADRAESASSRERSYAYRMAILALRQGLPVSSELLKQAGIAPAYADLIRRWFASKQNR